MNTMEVGVVVPLGERWGGEVYEPAVAGESFRESPDLGGCYSNVCFTRIH